MLVWSFDASISQTTSHRRHNSEPENAWEKLQNKDNEKMPPYRRLMLYKEFLESYPQSRFAISAKANILTLCPAAKQAEADSRKRMTELEVCCHEEVLKSYTMAVVDSIKRRAQEDQNLEQERKAKLARPSEDLKQSHAKTIEQILHDPTIKEAYPKLRYSIEYDLARKVDYGYSIKKAGIYVRQKQVHAYAAIVKIFDEDSLVIKDQTTAGAGMREKFYSVSSPKIKFPEELRIHRICSLMVKSLPDTLLQKVASSSTISDLRESAIRTTSFSHQKEWQELLAIRATEDSDRDIRSISIDKLDAESWQHLFADIAIKDSHYSIRRLAMQKLDSEQWQNLIADIARKDKNEHLREDALERLDGEKWQALFAQIVSSEQDRLLRRTALRKMNPVEWQDLLSTMAKTEADSFIRKIVIDYLEPAKCQNLLADLAAHDSLLSIRRIAIGKLEEGKWEELCIQIAENEEDSTLRTLAIDKILDPNNLARIVLNTPYPIKYSALRRIKDREILLMIQEKTTSKGTRKSVKYKLRKMK